MPVIDLTQTLERKLHPATQEDFRTVVRTLPMIPVYANLCFAADGLAYPRSYKQGEEEAYVAACERSGVLPFTNLKFKETPEGFFRPDDSQADLAKDPQTRKKSLQGLIRGGRIHRLSFETRSGETFLAFKYELFPKLIENQYHITEGEIWLSNFYCCYDDKGYRELSGLRLNGNEILNSGLKLKSIVRLTLKGDDRELSPAAKKHILSWFDILATKSAK